MSESPLPLPHKVDILLVCPDVIVLRGIIPEWRDELIEVAENIQQWRQSRQIYHGQPDGERSYKNDFRTSRSLMISARGRYGQALARFEEALVRAFHTGVVAYKGYNDHLFVTDDSGYELLRYQEGERFGLHTDAILGKGGGYRQLSGVLYLNDNYTGGETYFPRQGVKFKGSAGDLLLFPSNFCYPHESLPVTKGTKYAIVTWFVAFPQRPIGNGEVPHEQEEVGSSVSGTAADDRVRCH